MSKITASVKWGNKVRDLDDWQRNANPYTVTLHYQGRQLTTAFFTGSAWTNDPTAADVLESLVSDAQGVEYTNFEGWVDEYGYEIDSVKAYKNAKRIYKACEQVARKLTRFLGGNPYDVLQHAYKDSGEFRTDDAGNVIVG